MSAIVEQQDDPSETLVRKARERLEGLTGPDYWRSLEELAGDPAFEVFLRSEFPQQASVLPENASAVDRRSFLQLMGASIALAGAAGCTRQPPEKIVPAVKAPEYRPGIPLGFATTTPSDGFGIGAVAESHDGRPTKLEGNPEHPASLGASDARQQASILELYDPDRSQVIRNGREIRPLGDLEYALQELLSRGERGGGRNMRVLVSTTTSPTEHRLLEEFRSKYPRARVHAWSPVARSSEIEGGRLALDTPAVTVAQLPATDILACFDADFVFNGPDRLRLIRQLSERRRATPGGPEPLRLYAAESAFSQTGAIADARIAGNPSRVLRLLNALAARLGIGAGSPALDEREGSWLDALAADLVKPGKRGLVLVGPSLGAEAYALAVAINMRLGAPGTSCDLITPPEDHPAIEDGLEALVRDMNRGAVDSLFIVEANPAYDAPASLAFGEALAKVPHSFHLGLYDDETAALCRWHIPAAHYLESWGDLRAFDGSASIVQPLIRPLYDGISRVEFLSLLARGTQGNPRELVRETWESNFGGASFEARWRESLRDGTIAGTRFPPLPPMQIRRFDHLRFEAPTETSLSIAIRPHPMIGDGRMANNGWLQECPAPLTKVTWENPVVLGTATAESMGLANGDSVILRIGDRQVQGAAWILPGQAEGVAAAYMGYGRRRVGKVAEGRGFNTAELLLADGSLPPGPASLEPTGEKQLVACTQDHGTLEGRHIVRWADWEKYEKDPAFAQHIGHAPGPDDTLYPLYPYEGHAWGMTIDTSSCVGCNACVVGCQAENNIPVVGPEQVAMGREMQWIRIDRYFSGDLEEPEVHHQPMLCQHCEQAPCEVVCPVNATVHDEEGLNLMVYNRCVGTRYCSNNCPYKVRRFNFFQYQDRDTESLALQRNPDVTVRTRGVMEKCTYCIQRINETRSRAKSEGREIRDGEIVTACQQACPADAITFGDINDPDSAVSQNRADPRNYAVLAELNTRPRTTYLAEVRNPPAALRKETASHDEESH